MTELEKIMLKKEKHKYRPKLTKEQKKAIIQLYFEPSDINYTYEMLGEMFGVTHNAIYKIVKKYVEDTKAEGGNNDTDKLPDL